MRDGLLWLRVGIVATMAIIILSQAYLMSLQQEEEEAAVDDEDAASGVISMRAVASDATDRLLEQLRPLLAAELENRLLANPEAPVDGKSQLPRVTAELLEGLAEAALGRPASLVMETCGPGTREDAPLLSSLLEPPPTSWHAAWADFGAPPQFLLAGNGTTLHELVGSSVWARYLPADAPSLLPHSPHAAASFLAFTDVARAESHVLLPRVSGSAFRAEGSPVVRVRPLGAVVRSDVFGAVGAALRGRGERGGAGCRGTRSYHVVYHAQLSKYFEWQAQYHHHAWLGSGQKPYANYTRLVSGCEADWLFAEIPSFLASPHPLAAVYGPIDKPHAIAQWLARALPQEEVVVIVDSDCLPLNDLSKYTRLVREGMPLAQKGYMDEGPQPGSPYGQLMAKYCAQCPSWQPLAVPYFIHRNDLRRLVPRWLIWCQTLQKDAALWPASWRDPEVALQWTLEMFAYIIASSELGLQHLVLDDLQVLGTDRRLGRASFIHYSNQIPLGQGASWAKKTEGAHRSIPWPLPEGPAIGPTQRALFQLLHNAMQATPISNHVYGGSYFSGIAHPAGCPPQRRRASIAPPRKGGPS